MAVGWCIIGMAQNRAMLFVGRALASAAIHSYSSSVGVYISETGWYEFADPKLLTKGDNILKWIFRSWPDHDLSSFGILLPKLFWPTVRNNWSRSREKLLKFEAEGPESAKFLRSLEQFIQTVKVHNNFW